MRAMAVKPAKAPKEKKVGTIEHYYPKVHAASVGLEADLKLGDTVHIQGHGDDIRGKVTSMQIDHVPIAEGHAGQHIGLQVPRKVHKKADVFKVEPAPAAAAAPAAKPKVAKKAKKAAKKAAQKPAKAAKKAKKAAKPRKAAKKKSKKAKARKAAPRRAKPKAAKRARKAKAGKSKRR